MYPKQYAHTINFLDAKTRKDHAKKSDSPLAANENGIQPQLKALMIEDEKICQIIQRRLLEDFGCEVTIAPTGEQGLAMFNGDFDFIILDINLPGISGLVVSKAIRSISEGRNVPIIGLSSVADSHKAECIAAGYNEVISKPADAEHLKTILQVYFPSEG